MRGSSTKQLNHFFGYKTNEQKQFKKRQLRRPFNAEDHLDGMNDLMSKLEKFFLNLTSAYPKNNIFDINRQSEFYYNTAMKLSDEIIDILNTYSSQIPNEIRLTLSDNIKTLKLATLVLKEEKNDWSDKFSLSNDPEFDCLAVKQDENLNVLLSRIEEAERVDKLSSHNNLGMPKF